MSAIILESVLTCPYCGFAKQESMPTDACTGLAKPAAVERQKSKGLKLRISVIRRGTCINSEGT